MGQQSKGDWEQKQKQSQREKKRENKMREQQCRRLLPGSFSCTHICLQRVWVDPHVFAQVAWLPFLPPLSSTKDPMSFLSLQSPWPRDSCTVEAKVAAAELHPWLSICHFWPYKISASRSLKKKYSRVTWLNKSVNSGLFFFLKCVCELVGMCMCISVTLAFCSGACCLGTAVQPGASAPQRGLLLTTCHHR